MSIAHQLIKVQTIHEKKNNNDLDSDDDLNDFENQIKMLTNNIKGKINEIVDIQKAELDRPEFNFNPELIYIRKKTYVKLLDRVNNCFKQDPITPDVQINIQKNNISSFVKSKNNIYQNYFKPSQLSRGENNDNFSESQAQVQAQNQSQSQDQYNSDKYTFINISDQSLISFKSINQREITMRNNNSNKKLFIIKSIKNLNNIFANEKNYEVKKILNVRDYHIIQLDFSSLDELPKQLNLLSEVKLINTDFIIQFSINHFVFYETMFSILQQNNMTDINVQLLYEISIEKKLLFQNFNKDNILELSYSDLPLKCLYQTGDILTAKNQILPRCEILLPDFTNLFKTKGTINLFEKNTNLLFNLSKLQNIIPYTFLYQGKKFPITLDLNYDFKIQESDLDNYRGHIAFKFKDRSCISLFDLQKFLVF